MNVFAEAASRLPGHWMQGNVSDDNGNFCAGGIIESILEEKYGLTHLGQQPQTTWIEKDEELVARLSLLSKIAVEQYPDRLDTRCPDSIWAVADVNDHKDTTEADMVALLEKAAVQLDERVED